MNIFTSLIRAIRLPGTGRGAGADAPVSITNLDQLKEACEILFEQLPVGVLVFDVKGVVRYCNPASYLEGGYSREDYLDRHYTEVSTVLEDDIPRYEKLWKAVNRDEVVEPIDAVYKHRDGRALYSTCSVSVLKAGGKKVGVILLTKDITARKHAEEALRESEEKFFKVFRVSPSLLIITRIRDSRMIDVNDSFERITGYKREEVIGHTASEFDFWARIEERDKMIEELEKCGTVCNRQIEFHMKSGEVRTGLVSAELSSIAGEPCIIFIASDITEHRRAVEALSESEERYRDLFDNTGDIIQCVAPDGSFQYVNNSWKRTLGYSDEEIAGMKIFDILHPDYTEHSVATFRRVLAGEQVDQVNTALVGKNGNKIIVEGDVTCKYDNDELRYVHGIFRDITRRKSMEEQMLCLSSAISMSTNCVIITDCYATILEVNEKTMELYGAGSREELIGRKFLEIIAPEDRRTVNMDVKKIIEKGHLDSRDYHMLTRDGQQFCVQMSTSLVKDIDGNPMGLVRVGREIGGSR